MATIVTRAGKGSPLTNAEVDANFTNLNNELAAKVPTASLATVATSGSYTDLTNRPTNVSYWTNDAGYLTSISSSQVIAALGYTPYNASNPAGYISGITSGMVTTALGYTPYNSSNPAGYITGITSSNVTTALGYTPANKAGDTFTGGIGIGYSPTAGGGGGGRLIPSPGSPYSLRQEFASDNTGWRYSIAKNVSGTITDLFYVQDSGTVVSLGDIRAPIFYDTDNTAYYVDPANISNLNQINLGDSSKFIRGGASGQTILGVGSANDAYLQVGGNYYSIWNSGNFDPSSKQNALGYTPANKAGDNFTGAVGFVGGSAVAANGDFYARRSGGNTGVYYFVDGGDKYLYWDSVQYIYGGTYTVAASRFYGVNDVRAPIFYDSNNTNYYVYPSNTSVLYNVRAREVQFTSGVGAFRLDNGTYNLLNDPTGRYAIYLGGTGDPANYYDNTTHYFRDRGGVQYATIAAAGMYGARFYDFNDSAYYVDPNSSSVLNTLYLRTGSIQAKFAQASQFGYSPSYRTVVIGNEYLTTISMGVDVSGNASGSFNGGGEGREILFRNGVNFITPNSANDSYLNPLNLLDGYAYNYTSMRSSIFYDSANTGYYIDPASSSNIVHLYGNFISLSNDEGLNVKGIRGQFSAGSDGQGISLFSNVDIGYPNGWGAGLGNTPSRGLSVYGGGRFAYSGSGFLSADTSVRAPIFYDSNNTSFYVNPDDDTNLSAVRARGQIRATGWWGETYSGSVGGLGIEIGRSGGTSYVLSYNRDASTYGPMQFEATSYNFANVGGSYVTVANSVRAPIFYDSDNTGWYLDPASTSSLNNLNVNGSTVYPAQWTTRFQSSSDFPNGTLVTTDIPATASAGDSFIIEITGKSYDGSNPPFKVVAQGYLYSDTIISYSGISYGGSFSSYIKVFQDGGVLKFWWPRISYWNSFNVNVMSMDGQTNNTITRNRVAAITDSTEPTGTKKVQINLIQALRENAWINNKYFASSGEIFGTVFYDSNDSAYFVDPNTSGISAVFAGDIHINDTTWGTDKALRFREGATDTYGAFIKYTALDNLELGTRNGAASDTRAIYINRGANWAGSDGSFRAPIFYDSGNTGYYLNPNDVSNLFTTKFNTASGGATGRTVVIKDETTSEILFGSYPGGWTSALQIQNNDNSDFVWISPLDLNNNARIRTGGCGLDIYTDGGNDTGTHSLFVGSGYAQGISSLRAPIFYDSNATSYYLDPASTSNLNRLVLEPRNDNYFVGAVNQQDSVSDWQSLTNTFGQFTVTQFNNIGSYTNSPSGVYGYGSVLSWRTNAHSFQLYASHTGDLAYKTQWNNDNYSGWLTPVVYGRNAGSSSGKTIYGSVYYDSDDSSYYVNPNGGSVLGGDISILGPRNIVLSSSSGSVQIKGNSAGWSTGLLFYGSAGTYKGGFGALGAADTLDYYWIGSDYNTASLYVYPGSYTQSNSSLRAPVFYDSQNTGYYCDPNATSYFANLTVVNTIGGSVSGLSGALRSEGYGSTNLTYYQTSGDFAGTTGWAHYIIANHGDGASYYNYMMRLPFWSAPQYRRQTGDTASVTPWYTFLSTENFTQYAMPINGVAENTVDIRAPIFYDYNNTAWYCDPAGNSFLSNIYTDTVNSTAVGDPLELCYARGNEVRIGPGGGNLPIVAGEYTRYAAGTGYLSGRYSSVETSTTTGPIYTIGGSYYPTATSLNTMYGIGYTLGGSSGVYSGASWGLYVAANGVARLFLDGDTGVGYANGSFRAPVFYDLNNTGYYVDPAGTSLMSDAVIAGRSISTAMVYAGFTLDANTMPSNSTGFTYSVNAPYTGPIMRVSAGGGYDLWLNASYGYGGETLSFRTRNGDISTLNPWRRLVVYGVNPGSGVGNLYADAYYDSNNTSYYVDAASESVLNTLTLFGELNLSASGTNYVDHSGTITFRNQANYVNSATLTTGGDFTASGNVSAYSDARLKEDVETVANALDLVASMRGVTYTRKDTGSKGVGVIAQEMLEVIPQVVQQGEDGTLSVAYGNLVGVLIEAIKELKTEVETLKATVH